MFPRHVSSQILKALGDSPVVLLHGARQTGKSTLVKDLVSRDYRAQYVTLDDPTVLAAARADPVGFLAGIEGPVALDEVQRVPDLFLAIKAQVDRSRQPGRYLLTGSANIWMVPKLSESLAGRIEILPLWPLSQGEIERHEESFVDALFADSPVRPQAGADSRGDLTVRMLRGGYPEACHRPTWERRQAWFSSYVMTILQRDVRDLANIEGLTAMPRLLALLAARVGRLMNHAEVSRSLAMPQTTLKRYMSLLEATFLVQLVPPWSSNLGKRLVKSSKLYLIDTGLAASLLGHSKQESLERSALIGHLFENFVVMELRKQIGWSRTRPELSHFRTLAGQEVDVVLEAPSGQIVGIEVKAAGAVNPDAFRGLRVLAEQAGDRFHRGVVLYAGRETVPFGGNMFALPLDSLWRM